MLELVLVLKGNRNRVWTRLEAFVTYLGVVLVSCRCPLWHHKGLASRLLGFRIKNMDFSNFFWVNWKWSTSNLTFTWWRGCRGLSHWDIFLFYFQHIRPSKQWFKALQLWFKSVCFKTNSWFWPNFISLFFISWPSGIAFMNKQSKLFKGLIFFVCFLQT